MCDFFSFCSDGKKKYYFDWTDRTTLKDLNFDSHASIAKHFLLNEDDLNKYEYNLFIKQLTVDNLCCMENKEDVQFWCDNLNWKEVIEPLIVKPIVNPLLLETKISVGEAIKPLKKWQVIYSTIYSAAYSSAASEIYSEVYSAVTLAIGSAANSIVYSAVALAAGAAVYSAVASAIYSAIHLNAGSAVYSAVYSALWAYISSLFDIQYKYDFSSAIKLWESGYIPSFDGTTWRLHCGKKAKIVWEEKI